MEYNRLTLRSSRLYSCSSPKKIALPGVFMMYCFAIHSIVHSMYLALLVHFIPNAVVPSVTVALQRSLRHCQVTSFLVISNPSLARYAPLKLNDPFYFFFISACFIFISAISLHRYTLQIVHSPDFLLIPFLLIRLFYPISPVINSIHMPPFLFCLLHAIQLMIV